jgi:hypothetical protein
MAKIGADLRAAAQFGELGDGSCLFREGGGVAVGNGRVLPLKTVEDGFKVCFRVRCAADDRTTTERKLKPSLVA